MIDYFEDDVVGMNADGMQSCRSESLCGWERGKVMETVSVLAGLKLDLWLVFFVAG